MACVGLSDVRHCAILFKLKIKLKQDTKFEQRQVKIILSIMGIIINQVAFISEKYNNTTITMIVGSISLFSFNIDL